MAFVVTAVAGFSAVAAAAGTLAAVASVATAVATLGTVMTVVGAVTGSQKLMKYGSYLGMAGGIVSIGASLMSGAASAAGSAAANTAADTAATTAGEEVAKSYAVDLGADDIIKTAFQNSGSDEIIGSAMASGQAAQAPLSQAALGADAINTASNVSSAGNVSSASNIAGSQVAPITAQDLAFKAPELTSAQISNAGKAFSIAPATTASSGNWLTDWWGKLDQREKTAALQMGGKAAEGLFAGWTQEQRNKFEQEKYNLMQQNANAQPIMRFNNAGLINSKG